MARTIGYDPQEVRGAVQLAFYRKGFAETSLVDLEAATGLNRRQLYNGFGDKRDLFLRILEDFCESAGRRFLSRLERDDANLDAVEATLNSMLDAAKTPEGRLGCLICNTAGEPIAKDPAVSTRVDGYFRRIERAYRNALENAQTSGSLSAKRNPEALARYFFGVHVSLCILGRAGESIDVLRDVAAESLFRLS